MEKCLIISLLFCLFSCNTDETLPVITQPSSNNTNFIENFDNQNNFAEFWEDASQNSPANYSLNNQHLIITTRANVADRVKVKTKRNDFGLGTYTWRIYVSERTIGDKNSIGAFLYLDDNHELDFEIGSGKVALRNQLNAQSDDLIVYCTSQNSPFISTPFLIQHNKWYDFKIEISNSSNNNYLVKWYVDTTQLQTQELDYGQTKLFAAYCSLENLNFIGDQLPNQDYNVQFSTFKFEESN